MSNLLSFVIRVFQASRSPESLVCPDASVLHIGNGMLIKPLRGGGKGGVHPNESSCSAKLSVCVCYSPEQLSENRNSQGWLVEQCR